MTPASAKKAACAAFSEKVTAAAEIVPWSADEICVTVNLPDGRGHTWSGPANTKLADVTAFFSAWQAKTGGG